MKKILCGIVFAAAGVAFGERMWYTNEDETSVKLWDYVPAWRVSAGAADRLPAASDEVAFDSASLNAAAGREPITIADGIDAVCDTMSIATTAKGSGSCYLDDGRIIGARMTGGTLTPTHAGTTIAGLSIGKSNAGYGVFDFSGGVIDVGRVHVGDNGIGVMTNSGGFVSMRCGTNNQWATRFIVGNNAGSRGTYVMSGGIIACTNDNWNPQVWIGNSGEGRFEWSGGVISNSMIVGRTAGGRGVMEMSGGTLENWLIVGDSAGATGVVNMTSGKINGDVNVGYCGDGTFTLADDARIDEFKSMFVGREPGGFGRATLSPNGGVPSSNGRTGTLYVGFHGDGEAEIDGNIAFGYVKVGLTNSAYGSLRINEGKTLGVQTQLSIAGAPVPPGLNGTKSEAEPNGHNTYEGGRGELVMRGGTVKFLDAGYGAANLFIGRYANENPGAFGIVHGWGKFARAADNVNNVRMAMGDGQIIADGFGGQRTLSFNEVVNISNITANAASSTNGWYAVNKGCVHFPRAWFSSASSGVKGFGTFSYSNMSGRKPAFVNSIHFNMRGATHNANHFRGGFYASDRDDVHADALPPKSEVVGVWKFGLFSTVHTVDRVGFSNVDLTFRYDHTKVRPSRTLVLSRWNDATGRWEKLLSTAPTADNCITVNNLAPQRVGDYNVGLFALTARTQGMAIILK